MKFDIGKVNVRYLKPNQISKTKMLKKTKTKTYMKPSVISIVLGGGHGSRLFPLTDKRSKPAVPIAGKYRLVDIPYF